MIQTDSKIDATGLACPMPIVKTRKAMKELAPGDVLEVQATDRGSIADIKAWSQSAGHHYIGTKEEDGVIYHYLRKSSNEEREENRYPHVVTNDTLEEMLGADEAIKLVDVREAAEFAFGHIPGAISVPFGKLEDEMKDWSRETAICVICRTGNRSDRAAQQLAEAGFTNVKNVVPGMSGWNGSIQKNMN